MVDDGEDPLAPWLAVGEESHAVDFQKEERGREGIITTNKISFPLLLLLHHHDPVLTLRITHANKRGDGWKGVCEQIFFGRASVRKIV